MKKTTLLKIFFTGLLLAVLLFKVNIFDIVHCALSLNPLYLTGALLLVPVLLILRTWRWNLFLGSVGIHLPFFESLKVLLIGNFYGLITPGRIGELGRAYHMNEKKVITLPTVILEKIIDIWTLIGLSLVTIFFYFPDNSIMIGIIILCCIALPAAILLLMNEKILQGIAGVFGIRKEESSQFSENFRGLINNYSLVVFSFFISLIYYCIAYLLGYLIIVSAGFNPVVFITLPIIVLMGNIPLTIAGIGLRESVGSVAFVYLGETAANGFVFAFLLFIFISVLPGFVGYILAMKEEVPQKRKTGQMTGLLSPFLESRRMKKITRIVTGGTVLDYGCGAGNIIPALSYTRYTGTDLDRTVLSKTKKKYADEKNVYFFTVEDFEELDEKYDFIILSAVIEHLEDPIKTMHELGMLLKDHGIIVITTPTPLGNNFLKFGSRLGIFSRSAFEEHHRIFTRNDFIILAEKLNLKIIKYDTFEIGMNQLVVLSHDE